jgi:hypothetical protein
MQLAGPCVPWKIASSAKNVVLEVLQFQNMGVCSKFAGGAGISHYRKNEYLMES